jgi:hypothetical protein
MVSRLSCHMSLIKHLNRVPRFSMFLLFQHSASIYRQTRQYPTHRAYSGNPFYNRTKRKRDSSNVGRINLASAENGFHHRPPHLHHHQQQVSNGEGDHAGKEKPTPWNPRGFSYAEGIIG